MKAAEARRAEALRSRFRRKAEPCLRQPSSSAAASLGDAERNRLTAVLMHTQRAVSAALKREVLKLS